MPIIQISKIQQRSGNLVDLPQLDNAQFGWAYDQNRLFIGRSGSNVTPQNIEVLTAYSNLSFSQVTGTNGSNISITSEQNGELLAYNSTANAWVNAGGNAGGQINLGNVANVKISDGAIGYVLQTDGYGNLTWTPKTTVVANINSLSTDDPIIMNVNANTPYTNGSQVTITGVSGTNANAIVNSHEFYVKVANDYPTSGNVSLYTDSGLTVGANGFYLTATANTGTATTAVVNTGVAYATGSNTSIQYNNGGFLDGSANLTISGSNLNLSGNFTVSNVYANSGIVVASALTGPLTTNAQPNVTSLGSLINLSVTGNANIGNIGTELITATGNINGGNLNTAGAVLTNGGNATTSAVIITTNNANGGAGYAGIMQLVNTTGGATNPNKFIRLDTTGNFQIINSGYSSTIFNLTDTGALSIIGNANVGNLGTTGVYSTTLSATGNANIGNIGTAGLITATGNVRGANLVTSGLITATGNINGGNLVTTGTVGSAGATHLGNIITTGSNATAGNITGNWTLTAGSRWNATYADLAEYYESDKNYEGGTVLEFGGEKEVTLASIETTRVAGVVSTDPAYVLNATCPGEFTTPIALQGRVPVKVLGNVSKGDMMVSGGNGFAKTSHDPKMGTIIGKSLENFNGLEGIIEIAIGRL